MDGWYRITKVWLTTGCPFPGDAALMRDGEMMALPSHLRGHTRINGVQRRYRHDLGVPHYESRVSRFPWPNEALAAEGIRTHPYRGKEKKEKHRGTTYWSRPGRRT